MKPSTVTPDRIAAARAHLAALFELPERDIVLVNSRVQRRDDVPYYYQVELELRFPLEGMLAERQEAAERAKAEENADPQA